MRRILETMALAGRCEAENVPGTVTEKVRFMRQPCQGFCINEVFLRL